MSVIFLCGDARSELRALPDGYFHCVVTSPPYYGLRAYDGGQEVWDENEDCAHEWSVAVLRCTSHTAGETNPGKEHYTKDAGAWQDGHSRICAKCGAWLGQLGAEPSPQLYIQHLVQVFREIRRVLRPDGVVWLNIGDSWASGKGTCYNPGGGVGSMSRHMVLKTDAAYPLDRHNKSDLLAQGMKPLDMVLVPAQLALACRADDWYVRSIVCWSKNNPMPESVNGWRWERHRILIKAGKTVAGGTRADRPLKSPVHGYRGDGWEVRSIEGRPASAASTCPGCPKCSPNGGFVLRKGSWRPTDAHEYILMLTKTDSYYCDKDAVLEDGAYPPGELRHGGDGHKSLACDSRTTAGLHRKDWCGNGKRNLRSVWVFPTRPFRGAHFATFPPRLVELCVGSSTSVRGCCSACGAPWARVDDEAQSWLPTCGCSRGGRPLASVPCRVLDPFAGAGTTALVCERLGVDSVSVDTSAKYIAMAEERLTQESAPVLLPAPSGDD